MSLNMLPHNVFVLGLKYKEKCLNPRMFSVELRTKYDNCLKSYCK